MRIIVSKSNTFNLQQERTAGTEELQQTINNVESVNKLIFKTPHIPRIHTSQPIPLVNISQTLTSETDVDAFWLNFDDKMGGSPKESKISVSVLILFVVKYFLF